VEFLVADPSKAKKELKWNFQTDYKKLAEIMVKSDLKLHSKK
jgi:GDP-D-mannose dehydratase